MRGAELRDEVVAPRDAQAALPQRLSMFGSSRQDDDVRDRGEMGGVEASDRPAADDDHPHGAGTFSGAARVTSTSRPFCTWMIGTLTCGFRPWR